MKKDYAVELQGLGCYRQDLFKKLVPKEIKLRKHNQWSYLCAHNSCGFFHPDNCSDVAKCCHHSFSISPASYYGYIGFMKCFFYKVPNTQPDNPKVWFKWKQWAHRKQLRGEHFFGLPGACNGFIKVMKEHMELVHKGKPLPPALLSVVDANKQIDMNALLMNHGLIDFIQGKFEYHLIIRF